MSCLIPVLGLFDCRNSVLVTGRTTVSLRLCNMWQIVTCLGTESMHRSRRARLPVLRQAPLGLPKRVLSPKATG